MSSTDRRSEAAAPADAGVAPHAGAHASSSVSAATAAVALIAVPSCRGGAIAHCGRRRAAARRGAPCAAHGGGVWRLHRPHCPVHAAVTECGRNIAHPIRDTCNDKQATRPSFRPGRCSGRRPAGCRGGFAGHRRRRPALTRQGHPSSAADGGRPPPSSSSHSLARARAAVLGARGATKRRSSGIIRRAVTARARNTRPGNGPVVTIKAKAGAPSNADAKVRMVANATPRKEAPVRGSCTLVTREAMVLAPRARQKCSVLEVRYRIRLA